jgi:ABC-2 type transport system ATP-binding protein
VSGHAIECRQLTKRFADVSALDALDLEVPRGSLFGFLGPNGAGKTTVMRLLLGLARPTSGSAQVLGFDTVTDSLEVRRRVGYLPQQPLFPAELTVREVMRYAAGFFPRDRDAEIDDDIADVLDLVGMCAKTDSRTGELSGGQRQRLGIAQAQIHRPELLILDEPAAALDPLGRRDVLDVMRRLQATATVFYSTHILDDVQQVSDEVAILKAGRRVLQAPMSEVLRDGDHVFDLVLTGPLEPVVAELRAQPWVGAVRLGDESPAGTCRLMVEARDPDAAYRDLLRLVLADRRVQVRAFGPRTTELEDVFIDLVDGGTR